MINHNGGNLTLNTDRAGYRRTPRAEPVIEDADGVLLKPSPFDGVSSFTDLEDKLREFWQWAGEPSSRTVAGRSNGAFSHATVAKLIYNKPDKPPLKMSYVLGFVRGCGGDQAEQQRWVTAWRIINKAMAEGQEELHIFQQLQRAAAMGGTIEPEPEGPRRGRVVRLGQTRAG